MALWLAPVLMALVVWLHMRRTVPERTRTFFGAFLTPAEPVQQRMNARLRQPALMALRLVLAALLVVLLAGPYRETRLAGAQSARWVLVDASLSMRLALSREDPTRSRFEVAMARAREYARQGAELRLCGADLALPDSGVEHGRMNLDRCVAAARSSYAGPIVVLTDGQGVEAVPSADPQLQLEYVGPIPDSGGEMRPWQPLGLERGDQGGQVVRNARSDGPLDVALRSPAGPNSSAMTRCEAQQRCVLGEAGAQSWLQARLPAGPIRLDAQTSEQVLVAPVDWAVPLLDPALTITVVASVAERGLYSGRQILLEALAALAASNPRYTVVVAREPQQLVGRRGFIVLLWDSLERDAWTDALIQRDRSSILWVVPSRGLPDTLVPRELVFGFGTYRGWLEAPTLVRPSAVAGAQSEVDWQGSSAQVARRLSIAETGTAETVLADQQGNPLILWSGTPDHTLLFTAGVDAAIADWALTPDFVPMLAVLLARYAPDDLSQDRCVAGSVIASGSVCPGMAGREIMPDGTISYVLPDFVDLSARSWRTPSTVDVAASTRRDPLGAWLAAAAVALMASVLALPPAWLALLAVLSLPDAGWSQDVVETVDAEALRQSVYTLPGLAPDQGRQDAFRRLSVELDRRANISLRTPELATGGAPTGALVWLHLCRISDSVLAAALPQAVESVRQGAVLWVEDCAAPDEVSPAFRALTSALRNVRIASNWESIGSRHVIFKSYYLLSRIEGRQLAGGERVVASDGMPVVLYMPQDLTGKVAYDGLSEARARGFVNVMFYLLMGDYKEDGIHVPFLLERLHRTRR